MGHVPDNKLIGLDWIMINCDDLKVNNFKNVTDIIFSYHFIRISLVYYYYIEVYYYNNLMVL